MAQIHKKTNIATTEWEWHFDKLQHGLIFDENNPDVIDISENENCNKKLTQNDAGLSQNKTHSLKKHAENKMKGLRAILKHLNTDKKKILDIKPDPQKFPHETFNKTETDRFEPQVECQSLCLCSHENIWDSEKKNITEIGILKIYDHCKKHHELYLNYNSEKKKSSWADMMEKNLKWNKQQNLDDENQKAIHNIKS